MNLIERVDDLEKRMLIIEEQLGISKEFKKLDEAQKALEEAYKPKEPEPEKTVGGFTKDQLKIMFTWAKGLRLNQLTKGDFNELKKWEVLKDFYPDAPENYEDIKR